MTASSARYFVYDFTHAAWQKNVASVVTDVDLLFANKAVLNPDESDITFEGDGQVKHVYITKGITVEYTPDVVDLNAISSMFGKSEVTGSLPSGLARGTWMGDTTEAAGVSAGWWGRANAIKDVAGVQTAVRVRIWVPLGTLTISKPPGLNTAAKAEQMVWRLSAVRTTLDVAGNALPSVPSGGAFYFLAEES